MVTGLKKQRKSVGKSYEKLRQPRCFMCSYRFVHVQEFYILSSLIKIQNIHSHKQVFIDSLHFLLLPTNKLAILLHNDKCHLAFYAIQASFETSPCAGP